MDQNLVSVIIPAHNCAHYIRQAIDSALIQEVPMEILVIDDGSRDNLDQVMQDYVKDPRVRYLKNEKNLGVAKTRNRGVDLAKGNFVAFLDADDYWLPGKLRKQLALIGDTSVVLCSTARELMLPGGELTGHVIPVKDIITYHDLLHHNQINCSSVLIRTEVAREFPMFHDDSHEDYLMWMRVLERYGIAYGINEPLLKYRVTLTGKSGNKWKSAKMTFQAYRYMGFGWVKSILCFCSYAVHGVIKHSAYMWRRKK